ncbi:hypothetical protein, partial [Pseudomonas sp.]|uniref:hypothetical protein n=1 Tax=Pseudomonas sp. TaxID=306 RepID=UPI003FD80759
MKNSASSMFISYPATKLPFRLSPLLPVKPVIPSTTPPKWKSLPYVPHLKSWRPTPKASALGGCARLPCAASLQQITAR